MCVQQKKTCFVAPLTKPKYCDTLAPRPARLERNPPDKQHPPAHAITLVHLARASELGRAPPPLSFARTSPPRGRLRRHDGLVIRRVFGIRGVVSKKVPPDMARRLADGGKDVGLLGVVLRSTKHWERGGMRRLSRSYWVRHCRVAKKPKADVGANNGHHHHRDDERLDAS